MSAFRRAYKILLILILDVFFLLPGLAIALALFLGKRRQRLLQAYGLSLWAKSLCVVLGIHIKIYGSRPKDQGLFVASNHSSYSDILVIGSILPSVFVSKAEVKSWVLLGLLASLAGTIFVRREAPRSTMTAVGEVRERLKTGVNVVVFPEGTTDDGREVETFKSAFFEIPAGAGMPVLPLSIYYAFCDGLPTSLGPANELAWRNMPLFTHFWNLLSKRRIDVMVHFNDIIVPSGPSRDRKELAALTWQAVSEAFRMLKEKADD